jgi:glycosyltransferase involved in cell wall biosynthesis
MRLSTSPVRFAFIVASHENRPWVRRNLESVFRQDYPHWRIVYIDDASTDGTAPMVRRVTAEHRMDHRLELRQNTERRFAAYNRLQGARSCSDEEICVLLDGDDWLSDDGVLEALAGLYQAHDLLVSYGQFLYYHQGVLGRHSGQREYPVEVVRNRSYRSHVWTPQHLRTVQAGLFKQIPERSLQDWNGNWLDRCTDHAEMFWVLEHSQGRHRNSGRICCIYNRDSSESRERSYFRDRSEYRRQVLGWIRSNGAEGTGDRAPIGPS